MPRHDQRPSRAVTHQSVDFSSNFATLCSWLKREHIIINPSSLGNCLCKNVNESGFHKPEHARACSVYSARRFTKRSKWTLVLTSLHGDHSFHSDVKLIRSYYRNFYRGDTFSRLIPFSNTITLVEQEVDPKRIKSLINP